MPIRLFFSSCVVALLAVGCGGGSKGGDSGTDLSAPVVTSQSCRDSSDCASGQSCAYKIADGCAATGHCATVPEPSCDSIVELCGCDGKVAASGPCIFPDGYAGSPTTGAPYSDHCGDVDGGS